MVIDTVTKPNKQRTVQQPPSPADIEKLGFGGLMSGLSGGKSDKHTPMGQLNQQKAQKVNLPPKPMHKATPT